MIELRESRDDSLSPTPDLGYKNDRARHESKDDSLFPTLDLVSTNYEREKC